MVKTFEGHLSAQGLSLGIVVARFNSFITEKLLSGCLDAIRRHGGDEDALDIAWVPGAFEIPLVARKMAESGKYDAIICLGAVIRGATPHFDYVCAENAKGIAAVGLQTRRAHHLRSDHGRHHRAGCRAGRHQSGQQRLGRRFERDRNGQSS